jgi:hypothetical protein
LHALDLEGNVWTQPKIAGEKPAGRFAHTGVAHGKLLYFFGGHSKGQATFNFNEGQGPGFFSDKKRGKREADTEPVDEVICWNSESGSYSELLTEGAAPCPRYKHAACLVPEPRGAARMYMFGGKDEEGNALNDEFFLDLTSHATSWCVADSSGGRPSSRYGHSMTLLPAQRKLVVLGGTDGKQIDAASVHEFYR